jgi:protein kinase A
MVYVKYVQNERHGLTEVDHPGIAKCRGTCQDACNLYIFLDYVPGGELFLFLGAMDHCTLDVVRFVAAEVLLALDYLHSKELVYRNVRPDDLRLTPDGLIAFFDFTLAAHNAASIGCGTPEYMAPEAVRCERFVVVWDSHL